MEERKNSTALYEIRDFHVASDGVGVALFEVVPHVRRAGVHGACFER